MFNIYWFEPLSFLLIFLNFVQCERRGEVMISLRQFELESLREISEAGTFFTQENIKINSWHVTARWWKTQFLNGIRINFNQSDIDRLCSRRTDSCTFFDKTEWEQLPSVRPGSWKNCAVVGYGSNLLDTPRGDQIDSYDTVFRLGMVPLSTFTNEAGQKNTYVYVRDRKLRRSRGNFIDEDKNGFLASQLHESQRPEGIIYASYRRNPTANWPTLTFGGDLTIRLEQKLRKLLKRMTGSGLVPDPSSGLILPAVILFSGHCEKLGIFGISKTMGLRYWESKFRGSRKGMRKPGSKKRPRGLTSNHNTKLEAMFWKSIEMMRPFLKDTKVEFFD